MIPIIARRRRRGGRRSRVLRAFLIVVVLLGMIPLIMMDRGEEFGLLQWAMFSAATIIVMGVLFLFLRRHWSRDEEHSRDSGKPID
jgi:cation transport ATPase